MTISDAFGELFHSGSGFFSTAVITLFLIGIQAVLDGRFECPSNEYNPVLSGIYSLSFFLCPAFIFIIFGLLYFPGGNNKKRCCPCWAGTWNNCYVFLQIMKIPMIWLLIALTDGQFLACFVVAVSRYQLDLHLYIYIFQTSGILALTLFCLIWYLISKVTCPCLEESRRTYSLLNDVEKILRKDEIEKEKEEDTQRFLYALHRNGNFEYQPLPHYMQDKEEVLTEKLKEAHLASAAAEADNDGGH